MGGAKPHGYVVRDGSSLHFEKMAGPWDAPSLGQVHIPLAVDKAELYWQAGMGATWIFAWIASPEISEKGIADRNKLAQAIEAWRWRNAEHNRLIRKMDIPDWAISLKTDKMWRGMGRVRIEVCKKIFVCTSFLDPLLTGAPGLKGDVPLDAPTSVLSIALNMPEQKYNGGAYDDERTKADDLRKRLWRKNRHVLHLPAALKNLCFSTGRDLSDLLANPDWVENFLLDAEGWRCRMLPIMKNSIAVETTVQFRPMA